MKIKNFDDYIKQLPSVTSDEILEGLITTYKLSSLEKGLRTFLVAANQRFVPKPIPFNNTFELILKEYSIDLLKTLHDIADVRGYIIAQIVIIDHNQKSTIYKSIKAVNFTDDYLLSIHVCFESKFDKIVDKIPEKIYHVTLKKNINKILTKGISPRSFQKLAYHPHRIYFAVSLEKDEKIVRLFSQLSKLQKTDYEILEIDYSKLDSKIIFREDPNYKEEETQQLDGIYTSSNIHPNAIKQIK